MIDQVKSINTRSGFIAFTTLLVISAVALAISISISLLGVGSARSSFDVRKGQEVAQIAHGCYEEAMLRLKKDNEFAGMNGLSLGNGTCDITITGVGNERAIDVLAQITSPSLYTRRIAASVRVAPGSVNIISYNQN